MLGRERTSHSESGGSIVEEERGGRGREEEGGKKLNASNRRLDLKDGAELMPEGGRDGEGTGGGIQSRSLPKRKVVSCCEMTNGIRI